MENELEIGSEKIRVGITHGDINGIGYEIIIKALSDPRMLELFTPVVYGSSKVASYHRKTIDAGEFNFNVVKSGEPLSDRKANIINVYNQEIKIELGQCTPIAGELAYLALENAIDDIKHDRFDVLVTAPINKKNIRSEKFDFPGHTEYLAQKFGVPDPLMLMVSRNIRIGVITGHMPIKDVSKNISKDMILGKIRILNQSLIQDFGIRRPRIAIMGLNPHAGDKGVLGREEEEIIIPAIKQAFDEGILCYGPYPADGFFGAASFNSFDGILAMYHDQGLIPFKTLSFKSGVNFTAGLPYVRTSPAHGTAYELAGKNQSSDEAFREAIYLALDVYRNRKMHQELISNPLYSSQLDDEK